MYRLKLLLAIVPILLTGILFTACNDDDDQPGEVQLNISYTVGGEDLVFDDIRYQALAGHVFSVVRLKYYLSNVVLTRENGQTHPLNEVYYVDAGIESTNTIALGEIPNGKYNSISFVYGLDEVKNVDGGLPNTVENINMEWPIPGDQGYHYMKFEGKYDSLGMGVIKNFNLHTGATKGNQNYIEYNLGFNLSVNGNTLNIEMVMDLNEWLENPNTYDFEFYGPMIMANQDAQEVLKENGQSVFSILQQ